VSDLLSNYWVLMPVKVVAVLLIFLVFPLVVGYMEHKVMAHMQARLGPMEAGRFHGVLQLVADGVKFVQKESVVPRAADKWVFTLAPAVALIPVILVFGFIPYGPELTPIRSDVGLFVTLALSSVSVIGVLMAAWSSANKYSLIGGLRAAAQLIAYELPLVLAAAAVAMQAGSADLAVIVEQQRFWGWAGWALLPLTVGFFVYGTAALAELTRPPFDMPLADSEVVFGYLTEYTGLRFAFFLLTEYAGIVSQSAIAATLFLGGYKGVILPDGPWFLAVKVLALSFLVIWARSTYPRLREDQLQVIAWVRLVPVSLLLIFVVGLLKVV
jgi:NADH-quinone oxidoreductase subunit H